MTKNILFKTTCDYDSFMRFLRLTDVCAMTRSYVCRDSFMCDMAHSCVCHDSCICVSGLIHVCAMPHCSWRKSLKRPRLSALITASSTSDRIMTCVAVWCSVLQCVAVCYSVLKCVAVCCSVLQCVAAWCGRDSGVCPVSCLFCPYLYCTWGTWL